MRAGCKVRLLIIPPLDYKLFIVYFQLTNDLNFSLVNIVYVEVTERKEVNNF